MEPKMKELCLICKGGRALCGIRSCPLLERIRVQLPIMERMKSDIFGPTPPGIFVGWGGYPNVSWGPMVSVGDEDAALIDNPAKWYGLGINEIIKYRSSLVRSRKKEGVRGKSALLQKAQEAILSVKPIDVELKLAGAPTYKVSFSPVTQPMGPSAPLKDFRVCENPVIPKKVDELLVEEITAESSANELFSKGFDVYYITKLLSAGVLGRRKKLVPTRWSITATDDLLSKNFIERIKRFPEVSSFEVYTSEYLHNHFEVLLMPGKWEFEQFEAWSPGTLWTQGLASPQIVEEYEGWGGRKSYAVNEGGGYYAGRFAATEALANMRKQARVIIFREIYEGYVTPVGVWEVRENVREAFRKGGRRFSSLKDALDDVGSRLRIPIGEWVRRSRILTQGRLG